MGNTEATVMWSVSAVVITIVCIVISELVSASVMPVPPDSTRTVTVLISGQRWECYPESEMYFEEHLYEELGDK